MQISPIGHSALTQQIRLAFPRLLAEPGSPHTTKITSLAQSLTLLKDRPVSMALLHVHVPEQ
jgi:hypothetical protein